jgi:hypothetical protein
MATGSPKRAGRGIDQAHRQAEAGLTKQRKSPVVGGRAFPDGKRGAGGLGLRRPWTKYQLLARSNIDKCQSPVADG